jgi:hypothetical protein
MYLCQSQICNLKYSALRSQRSEDILRLEVSMSTVQRTPGRVVVPLFECGNKSPYVLDGPAYEISVPSPILLVVPVRSQVTSVSPLEEQVTRRVLPEAADKGYDMWVSQLPRQV